jgi:PPE-repeat protein
MDYLGLPPEINSARIESGPGAAPLLAAAAAWSGIAEVLSSTTSQMAAVQGTLSAAWSGPSALSEGLASSGYQAWVTQMAAMASATAASATAAATAYETTRAAMVPLTAVVANRTQLSTLVATNVLGQNTPAIMANEAAYAEMWAQDVAAMVGYQSETASATAGLTPPTPAPMVTTGSAPAAAITGAAANTVLPAATSLPAAASSPLSFLTTSNPLLTALADPTTPLGFLETQFLAFSSSGPGQYLSYPLFLGMMAQANQYQARANDLTEEGNRISTELEQDDRATAKMTPPAFEQPPPAHIGREGNIGKVGALSIPPNWDKSTQQVALASKATPLETTPGTMPGGGGMIPTPIAAVGGPQSKQRNGNEILVKVKFLPTRCV